MAFIPHTASDEQTMRETLHIAHSEVLFGEIPAGLQAKPFQHIPPPLNEMTLLRLMRERARHDHTHLNFIGAGAYEHHIPAAVWDIAARGEWMTAYTPYQAEASQGTLQLIYEYQTMIANLTGMDAANASLYEGASALAEAILMAVRLQKHHTRPRVLLPLSLSPYYRATVQTLLAPQAIELVEIPFDASGRIDSASLHHQTAQHPVTALVIPQPNFFGVVEEVDTLVRWAQQQQILTIAVVNPLSLALLKEPGQWGGASGVDIVCGELQPLGIPLASGGPYAGFLCCRQAYIRQMPGRVVGATVDKSGKRGFTLTLQAREQHIRRGKATSNICTNQGLLVTAATIYLSLLGFSGLQRVAQQCHHNTRLLLKKLLAIPGVTRPFSSPFFHEIVLQLPKSATLILEQLAQHGILAGYPLEADYPNLSNCMVLCATETKTEADIAQLSQKLQEQLCAMTH